MYRIVCLFSICCSVVIGCNSQSDSPGTAEEQDGGATVSLDISDLEQLANWNASSQASAILTEQLAEIMSEITDKESALGAIPKLRELAPKFAAVNRAEKAFGEPSKEDQTLVLKNLAKSHEKFDRFYTPLMDNEELKSLVSDAIDDAYVGNVSE